MRARRSGRVRPVGLPRGQRPAHARGTHALDAGDRLDGADEDRRWPPRRADDDVEAGVHAVDTVHVRDARGAEHGRSLRRLPETGMRRTVLRPAVRLDLDDPADAEPVVIFPDDVPPEKRRGGHLDRLEEQARERSGRAQR